MFKNIFFYAQTLSILMEKNTHLNSANRTHNRKCYLFCLPGKSCCHYQHKDFKEMYNKCRINTINTINTNIMRIISVVSTLIWSLTNIKESFCVCLILHTSMMIPKCLYNITTYSGIHVWYTKTYVCNTFQKHCKSYHFFFMLYCIICDNNSMISKVVLSKQ